MWRRGGWLPLAACLVALLGSAGLGSAGLGSAGLGSAGCSRDKESSAPVMSAGAKAVSSVAHEESSPNVLPAQENSASAEVANTKTTTDPNLPYGFALQLYSRLRQREGNLAFSPSSVELALSMAFLGARGDTATAMGKVLGVAGSPDAHHVKMRELLTEFSRVEDCEVVLANRLFPDRGLSLLPKFVEAARTQYQSPVEALDIAGDTETSRRHINRWAEEQTQGKIVDLIPPGQLDSSSPLVLANGLYFKGAWERAFDEKATSPAPFELDDGSQIQVPTMRTTATVGFAQVDGTEVLEVPYTSSALSMVIALPSSGASLSGLEDRLSQQRLSAWLQELRPMKLALALPRFRVETEAMDLAKELKQLGMVSAFSPSADFSGIASEPLWLSKVFHKSFVEVVESGTEAAAATAVVTTRGAPVKKVDVNRPFLFLIWHKPSQTLLFVGRVLRPTPA